LGHYHDGDLLASKLTKQEKIDQLSSVVRLLFHSCFRAAIGQPAQFLHFFFPKLAAQS
jgi:hypothetical protein